MPASPRRYGGLAVSIFLHGLLIGLLAAQGERIWSHARSPGDPSRSGSSAGAGGGGSRVAYITLPSLPRPAAPPKFTVTVPTPPKKAVETPAPEPVQLSQVPPEPADTMALGNPAAAATDTGAGAGAGNASDAGIGAGRGTGEGPGVGTGAGAGRGGEGGTLQPPEPRVISPPFDTPPKELRGVLLSVTFWVRADGQVERYRVEPQIKDEKYAKKFDEVMRAFRFTPARAPDGSRVAGTYSISFTLPGKRSS